ncbi:tetratricopeptide repeat protein [Croceitalea sp. MTPC5]|uniref:tetratricopeptide repeat protein n=1 Tax=Croceitalea sp. MTPC5 TaxID=3056565 RepID=UPI0030D3CB30
MKKWFLYGMLVAYYLLVWGTCHAQEEPGKTIDVEESSEVFLEEYTDEFQETFFEALKQKGIQNYDRAANLFLKCKTLDAENTVIDHELAKTYLLDKKYLSAQQYAIESLVVEPSNYWFLDTLIAILDKQSNTIDAVKTDIPFDDGQLQKNLALIYYKRKKYTDALTILKGLSKSDFTEELTLKIQDSMAKPKQSPSVKSTGQIVVNNDPVKVLEMNLEQQIRLGQFRMVEQRAKDAVETYPLQPYFYYAYGLALHKNNKSTQAIDVLQSSLDYLFENTALANKIYQTLSDAYQKTNNFSKANEYLSKIKPGF